MHRVCVVSTALVVAFAVSGCQSSQVVKKSTKELATLEAQANAARRQFHAGHFAAAAGAFEPLCEERHVNQPLYQCEQASSCLLAGERERAHQLLLSAHESIEGFFDTKSERKAASTWGRESDKVYKGDPYERGVLYLLLSLSFLEKGDTDSALAAVKTGLLADSDTENNAYTADFGLLQVVGAKCYALRNEPEMRDQMLAAAFESFTGHPAASRRFAASLCAQYHARVSAAGGNDSSIASLPPPDRMLAWICAMADEQHIRAWLQEHSEPGEPLDRIAEWADASTNAMNPVEFNTLLLVWQGLPPCMIRGGEHGEKRLIVPGKHDSRAHTSVVLNSSDWDVEEGLADVSFQATTRGGRAMDNVLARQAMVKGAASGTGNVLLAVSAGDYNDPLVNGVFLGAGLLLKGASAIVHSEADIRSWMCLPNAFDAIPLTLTPGAYTAELHHWRGFLPVADQTLSFSIQENAPFAAVHLKAVTVPPRTPGYMLQDRVRSLVCLENRTGILEADVNGDGELSRDEAERAFRRLLDRFDRDGDRAINKVEEKELTQALYREFKNGMIAR